MELLLELKQARVYHPILMVLQDPQSVVTDFVHSRHSLIISTPLSKLVTTVRTRLEADRTRGQPYMHFYRRNSTRPRLEPDRHSIAERIPHMTMPG